MARKVNRRRLVRLLEELRTVQSGLRDERIVVINAEDARALEGADDERDRLQLRAALGDALLVHGERLDVEVVSEVLEAAFVRDLRGQEEEPQRDGRCFDLRGEDRC